MSSSSYSHHAKNDSDGSNHSSVKSVEVNNYPKTKKKKVLKKKPKEIQKPPLHFDFNLVSSSSRPKEVLSISEEEASNQKAKSIYNYSVTSRKNDNLSSVSSKSRNYMNKNNIINNNQNIVKLPPPSKPNFIRKSQETIVKANFDDRWQLFLELKTLDKARNRIYFKVYFYKWKIATSTKFIERIKEKTASFEFNHESESNIKTIEKDKNNKADNAIDLINKARKKYDEYTSFLSQFEGQLSSYIQIPKKFNNGTTNTNNTSISNNNNINRSNIENHNFINSTSSINANLTQYRNANNSKKSHIFAKNENEEDNFSSFFNENDNNSTLVANKLINDSKQKVFDNMQETKDQQDSQLCEFDFTEYSDNLLQIETPQPFNSFTEPKPPSENSDSGEMPKSEVQISVDSITVANSFCDMIDNSISRSKELAVKTKTILADESQSSSDIENEFQDHSFIHEKKRRYISSSSSEDEDYFLPKLMIRYSKNHESSSSLADSFHVSRSSFENHLNERKDRKYSTGFPSDLYDEILSPLPVTKVKITSSKA